jgi:hypothetical protein
LVEGGSKEEMSGMGGREGEVRLLRVTSTIRVEGEEGGGKGRRREEEGEVPYLH